MEIILQLFSFGRKPAGSGGNVEGGGNELLRRVLCCMAEEIHEEIDND